MKYHCLDCGYIYDDKIEEISFMSLDEKWACPECNAPKSEFEPMNEEIEELKTEKNTEEIEDIETGFNEDDKEEELTDDENFDEIL